MLCFTFLQFGKKVQNQYKLRSYLKQFKDWWWTNNNGVVVARFVTGDDSVESTADGKYSIECRCQLLVVPALVRFKPSPSEHACRASNNKTDKQHQVRSKFLTCYQYRHQPARLAFYIQFIRLI